MRAPGLDSRMVGDHHGRGGWRVADLLPGCGGVGADGGGRRDVLAAVRGSRRVARAAGSAFIWEDSAGSCGRGPRCRDCLADLAVVEAHPGLFGALASEPTVSRLPHVLARDVDAAVGAIRSARARTRERVWAYGPVLPAAGKS